MKQSSRGAMNSLYGPRGGEVRRVQDGSYAHLECSEQHSLLISSTPPKMDARDCAFIVCIAVRLAAHSTPWCSDCSQWRMYDMGLNAVYSSLCGVASSST